MRNLKKVLAVTVAIVMAFSLMSPGLAVTDYTEFTDVNDINTSYIDAVALLTALQIIAGTDKGDFDPKGDVNRGQMAKMIYVIMNNGIDDGAKLYLNTTTPLTDISGHWAEGYIKYCYTKGIIAGVGNNTFLPDENVTGIQALKMILVALGYDPVKEGYVGYGWAGNIGIGAQTADLMGEIETIDMTEPISREVSAQIINNGLFATMVSYVNGILEKRLGANSFNPLTFALDRLGLVVVEGILVANDQVSVAYKDLDNAGVAEADKSTICVDMSLWSSTSGAGWDYVTVPASTKYTMVGKSVKAFVKLKAGESTARLNNKDVIAKAFGNVVETPGKNIVTLGVINDYETSNLNNTTQYYINYGDEYEMNSSNVQMGNITTGTAGRTLFEQYYKGSTTTVDGFQRISKTDYYGQQVILISNDANKSVEYVLGFDKRFGEISTYSNTSLSITINDSANYSGFSGIKFEDAYYTEDFALGDYVLMWETPNSEYILEAPATLTGKMSGSSGSSSDPSVIIDGTSYKIARDHIDFEDIIISDFVNQEISYFLDGKRICGVDAKGVNKTPDNYCVIRDTIAEGYWTSIADEETFKAAVLTSGGLKKTYEIEAVYANPNGGTKQVLTDSSGATSGNVGLAKQVYFANSKSDANSKNYTLLRDMVCKYSINSSGKIVLYLPYDSNRTNSLTASAYEKGAATVRIGGSSKLVNAETVAFIKSNAVYNPTDGDNNWYVFTGRNTIPSFSPAAGQQIDDANNNTNAVSAIYGKFSTAEDLAKAFAVKNTTWAGTSSGGDKYGFVLSARATVSGGEWFYDAITMFNGTEIITYSGLNGVKIGDAPMINGKEVNVSTGCVVKYTLENGKIDELIWVDLLNKSYNPNKFYSGYTATVNKTNKTISVFQDTTTLGKTKPGAFGVASDLKLLVYEGEAESQWFVYSGTAAIEKLNTQTPITKQISDNGKHVYATVVHEGDDSGVVEWMVLLNDGDKEADRERYSLSADDDTYVTSTMLGATVDGSVVNTAGGNFTATVNRTLASTLTADIAIKLANTAGDTAVTWALTDTTISSGLTAANLGLTINALNNPAAAPGGDPNNYTMTINKAAVTNFAGTVKLTFTPTAGTIKLEPVVVTIKVGSDTQIADYANLVSAVAKDFTALTTVTAYNTYTRASADKTPGGTNLFMLNTIGSSGVKYAYSNFAIGADRTAATAGNALVIATPSASDPIITTENDAITVPEAAGGTLGKTSTIDVTASNGSNDANAPFTITKTATPIELIYGA